MTDESPNHDAPRFPEPPALQPTPEPHRSYSPGAVSGGAGGKEPQVVPSPHAPKGDPGLFKPTRALLRSVTLGAYLDARKQRKQTHDERDARHLATNVSVSILGNGENSVGKKLQQNARRRAVRDSPPAVLTLDVETHTGDALRRLARANAHSAPLIDQNNKNFLGFVDVDDLPNGFFACLANEVPPPAMPGNVAVAAEHAFQRLGIADDMANLSPSDQEQFVRDEGTYWTFPKS